MIITDKRREWFVSNFCCRFSHLVAKERMSDDFILMRTDDQIGNLFQSEKQNLFRKQKLYKKAHFPLEISN